MKQFITIFAALVASACINVALAQDAPTTLFEYPVAPDTCTTLESRCNYLAQNFWNDFDISKPFSDDMAMAQTVRDYMNIVKFSHRNIALTSVRNFIYKARANKTNLQKVGLMCEAALYGPTAEFFSDELYMEVAKAMSESTSLKNEERNYYKHQVEVIGKCPTGGVMPDFNLVVDGKKCKLTDIEANVYLVFVVDQGSNSSIGRTRLSTDVNVNSLIDSNQIKVVQILLGKPDASWAATQPQNWVNASSEDMSNLIDLRFVPACFILDKEGKILYKNITVEEVKSALGS